MTSSFASVVPMPVDFLIGRRDPVSPSRLPISIFSSGCESVIAEALDFRVDLRFGPTSSSRVIPIRHEVARVGRCARERYFLRFLFYFFTFFFLIYVRCRVR